ncbi:gamma-glutamyl-gamma-aminobutyrate hydrolase family protein [Desulfoscipio gibsoniae]|uniref:Putative glutamine amidotransferase n=1 Tax=Desulfoscipio gibsoniae DSM 7213 TaxID=767817 RepID=R4KF07_9FIRM|nr:gamma-glutamyl-gamma-aminobutyrate hydrolase family protein [Desulfoscipio gibsoniae]AGL01773.1 putative glutamine amidotransferase [Desulfoscipio gibsoniae DSM 7213]
MYPLIGITSSYDAEAKKFIIGEDYPGAVQAAGGVPLFIPHHSEEHVAALLAGLDGLLLSGGGDIDPYYFGEEPLPVNGCIDPLRDGFEILLTKLALKKGMPILGICRGMQVLNVAAGGSVCQDLNLRVDRPLQHMQQAPRWYATHNIKLVKGSMLHGIMERESVRVNSFHHQMINDLGKNLVISAIAGDNVVEAIECADDKTFALGVQFHPENMYFKYPHIFSIFKAFIEACTRFLSSKKSLFLKDI